MTGHQPSDNHPSDSHPSDSQPNEGERSVSKTDLTGSTWGEAHPTRAGYWWFRKDTPDGKEDEKIVKVIWLGAELYSVEHSNPVPEIGKTADWTPEWAGPVQKPVEPSGEDESEIEEIAREAWEEGQKEPLFQDRTPAAAARQLSRVLAWMADCELATLERYERLSSSSKRETERHQEIVDKLIHHCIDLGVEPIGLGGKTCTRLRDEMKERVEKKSET
jgi:hypothetical protein